VDKKAEQLKDKLNSVVGPETSVLGSELSFATRFPSGSLGLDYILGGGWPVNQWVEVIGYESAGKTAVVLKTIAANQARDPAFTVMWVAGEHYDAVQAAALGVDNDRVMVVPTQDMQVAFTVMLEAAESRSVDMIVLDSYPSLIANEEEAKAMDDAVVAVGARLTGKFFRKAGRATRRSVKVEERPVMGIIINQWRDKIGAYGDPKVTPGGHAKDYAYCIRLEVTRGDWIRERRPGFEKPVKVGQTLHFKTIKNKSAPPQQEWNTDYFFTGAPFLNFRRGQYDVGKEYVSLAFDLGIIEKKGSWFAYNGDQWQGRDKAQLAVLEDRGLQKAIAADVMEHLKNDGHA
jgi:recombination protein RecA